MKCLGRRIPWKIFGRKLGGFGDSVSIGGIFGGEADAIIQGETGYLCDGNDLSALYDTLIKTLSNDRFKTLGSNALKFSKNFNWSKIVKEYIELI